MVIVQFTARKRIGSSKCIEVENEMQDAQPEFLIFESHWGDRELPEEDKYDFLYDNNEIYVTWKPTNSKICRLGNQFLKGDESDNTFNIYAYTKDKKKSQILQVGTNDAVDISKTQFKYISRKNRNAQCKAPLSLDYSCKKRSTYFSSENQSAANLRGFVVQAIGLALTQNVGLIIENFLKYEYVFLTTFIPMGQSVRGPFWLTTAGFGMFWLFQLGLEHLTMRRKISAGFHNFLTFLNCTAILVYTPLSNYYNKTGIFPAVILLMWTICNCFKIISWAHVMHNSREIMDKMRTYYEQQKTGKNTDDIRVAIKENEVNDGNLELLKKHLDNPASLLNFKDIVTFTLMPVLCFQLVFPKRKYIRWDFVGKKILETALYHVLMLFIFGQYVVPVLESAGVIYQEHGMLNLEFVSKFFRLTCPGVLAWICMFYGGFECNMNIQAEITLLSDREFYKDWWNSNSIAEYWRLWNLPVHNFLLRHMYFPMLKKGYSRAQCGLLIFFVSAVLHEYFMVFALFLPTFWFFIGMFGNALIIGMEQYVLRLIDPSLSGETKSTLKNAWFWFNLCVVGQPMVLMLYYIEALKAGLVDVK